MHDKNSKQVSIHPNVVDFQNQSMQMTEMRNQKNSQLANAAMNSG
jgi:hypothetical protein